MLQISAKMFSRHNVGIILFADIDFCPCCPPRGVHLPVQYDSLI